jgi:N-acetylglucosaminyldiphosphoundecaprenol N-acetyl-beta-D-mannosaminyltransferase
MNLVFCRILDYSIVMSRANILGILIDKIDREGAMSRLRDFLSSDKPHLIVTPNPEFILSAMEDEEFFHILNRADLSMLDGFGLQIAALVTGSFIRRYPGADLIPDLLELAAEQEAKVLVLNWKNGLSSKKEIKHTLGLKFANIDLEVIDMERDSEMRHLSEIRSLKPQIIIASLGAPHQEKTLYRLLHKVPTLRIAIGIGGALDFLTGKALRAPKILRLFGIEWLWRLARQPWRYRRIWNATVVFAARFVMWRFFKPFFYRKNVACWLYKKIGKKYYVLMVERSDAKNHWQIPQGGTDGEPLEVAAKREIWEELGVKDVETVAIYKNVWSYKFAKQGRGEVMRHLGYKGQKQSLFIGEFKGQDDQFKLNAWDHVAWKWVEIDKMIEQAYNLRQKSYKVYLKLFKDTFNIS